MANRKAVVLSFIAFVAVFIGISLIFDIGIVRWFTCASPFAVPQDKTSDVCNRLDHAP